jgi:hypothetical protein
MCMWCACTCCCKRIFSLSTHHPVQCIAPSYDPLVLAVHESQSVIWFICEVLQYSLVGLVLSVWIYCRMPKSKEFVTDSESDSDSEVCLLDVMLPCLLFLPCCSIFNGLPNRLRLTKDLLSCWCTDTMITIYKWDQLRLKFSFFVLFCYFIVIPCSSTLLDWCVMDNWLCHVCLPFFPTEITMAQVSRIKFMYYIACLLVPQCGL